MNPFAPWQTFYQIVGSAAGALTGLQFVAVVLIADVPLQPGELGVEAFSTPSVVHFVTALLLAASATMPWSRLWAATITWTAAGLAGLAYLFFSIRSMHRQEVYRPVAEDWLFHAILPFCAYAGLVAAALNLLRDTYAALFGVASVSLLLLVIGIHNSWDNLNYLVIMRRRYAHSTGAAGAPPSIAAEPRGRLE